ncbi:hypothetical protein [Streptomyces sp. NPDC055607]
MFDAFAECGDGGRDDFQELGGFRADLGQRPGEDLQRCGRVLDGVGEGPGSQVGKGPLTALVIATPRGRLLYGVDGESNGVGFRASSGLDSSLVEVKVSPLPLEADDCLLQVGEELVEFSFR